MQVSSAFVVIMGMGVTFVGLTCIIFLTMLMGKILSKPEAPKPAAAAAAPAAPAVPADGLTDEVKVAIMAANRPAARLQHGECDECQHPQDLILNSTSSFISERDGIAPSFLLP